MSQFKDAGVYCIINKINGKQYIGSSTNVYRRKDEHLSMLLKGCHHNTYLQASWNKYGGKFSFRFEVIELGISHQELFTKEREYILSRQTNTRDKGYNQTLPFGNGSPEHSEETKEKLRRLRYVQLFNTFNEELYQIWITEVNTIKENRTSQGDTTVYCINRYTGEILSEHKGPKATSIETNLPLKRIEEVLLVSHKRTYYKDFTFVRRRDYNPEQSYIQERAAWGQRSGSTRLSEEENKERIRTRAKEYYQKKKSQL